MGNAFSQSGLFLINVLFSAAITFVLLRFLLQWVKADFYNPFCQFLIKITNPLLVPLRRIIPGYFGLDLAAVVLIIILQLIEIGLVATIAGISFSPALLIVALLELVGLILNVYFFAILIRAIISWVNPNPYSPINDILIKLTEPLLGPVRKVIPVISGFDLSPIVVLILIQIIHIFIRNIF